jgi:hypothetical protein
VQLSEGSGQLDSDIARLGRIQRALPPQDVLERLTLYELHPEADTTVVYFGAVDLRQVLVPPVRQVTRFLQKTVHSIWVFAFGGFGEQLQRYFPMQQLFPGAKNLPKTTRTNTFDETQMSPGEKRQVLALAQYFSIRFGDARQELQVANDARFLAVRRGLLRAGPVDFLAVRQSRGQTIEVHSLRRHLRPRAPSRACEWPD